MLIRKLDPSKFVHAYNIDIQLLYPWEGTVETPFGAAWAVVPPGGSTKHHNHQEGETFFIARGQGEMTINDETAPVEPGDVVFQVPFQKHILRNTSETEELLFLTVWWEDKELWPDAEGEPAAAEPEPVQRRAMVTAAPPTPNGDLHVGHLSGPYLAADVHARALRLAGVDAYFACGGDDNSVYVKSKGEQLGLGPEETAKRFRSSIEETLAMAGFDLEVFVHPNSSPHHRKLTTEFFQRLHEGGKLVEKEIESPWCESCEEYLFEPYIGGRCPGCSGGVVGNTCEECGRVNDAHNLVDGRCTRCDSEPVTKPFKRLFFPLSQYADLLTEYHRKTVMNPHLRAFCEEVIAEGLPDVAVTHITDWGIPVPVEGYEDQRIYVWLEMAPRYFAYSQHLNDANDIDQGWERYWKSPEAEIVQCFGFDNSFYYSLLLPAMYKAFDPEIQLPRAFITNEFYRLDGQKFSTSRNHAIWGRDLLARVPADIVRFYLAYTAPETEGTNFTMSGFEATVERELIDRWQPWLTDLGDKLRSRFGGEVPSTGDWMEDHRNFMLHLERTVKEAREAYGAEAFSLQRATRLMCEVVRTARRFGKAQAHWAKVEARGEEQRTGVALEALAAKVLALVAAPVLPTFADRLWSDLGFAGSIPAGAWETALDWIPGGQEIGHLGESYFEWPPTGGLDQDSRPAVAPSEHTAEVTA